MCVNVRLFVLLATQRITSKTFCGFICKKYKQSRLLNLTHVFEMWMNHAALIFAQLIFAVNMIVVRAAFKSAPNASPLVFAVGRGVCALAALSAIHFVHSKSDKVDRFEGFSSKQKVLCYGIGFCGVTLNLIGVAYGVKLTDAITAGAFQCAIPPVSFVISWLCGDALSRTQVVALCLAVCGNALMAEVWQLASVAVNTTYYVGCLLLTINVCAYSTFLVLQKPFVTEMPKMEFLFRVNLSGVTGMIAIACLSFNTFVDQFVSGALTPQCWFAIAFAGLINSIVPYYLIAVGVSGASPSLAAVYFALQPVFVCVLSVVVLGEGLNFIRSVGGLFILSGLILSGVQKTPAVLVKTPLSESPRHEEINEELVHFFPYFVVSETLLDDEVSQRNCLSRCPKPRKMRKSQLFRQATNEALTPQAIVAVLDKHIVGQSEAKRAVAISLRNRWRRKQISDLGLQKDIMPKNILMIGPTGVGKTEIARRMAKLTDAPFVKVEATKYTEVGFKGKDVDTIIEDLFTNAKTKARRRLERERESEATKMARDSVFTALLHQQPRFATLTFDEFAVECDNGFTTNEALKEATVTIEVSVAPPEKSQKNANMQTMDVMLGIDRRKIKQPTTKTVPEALPLAKQEALSKLVDENQVNVVAKTLCEEDGIVFLDEIDKVVSDQAATSSDASALGVQQDLLPLIEGSNVSMKDGTTIATDNILFICSGAFHVAKPSDMIAELQGRLPVRVELAALKEQEFRRILVEPKFNLLEQQKALMKTEGVTVNFTESGIDALAKVTSTVNTNAQNIGARRLHTIIERVMDEYSFNCDKYFQQTIEIDNVKVEEATKILLKNVDLAKFLL